MRERPRARTRTAWPGEPNATSVACSTSVISRIGAPPCAGGYFRKSAPELNRVCCRPPRRKSQSFNHNRNILSFLHKLSTMSSILLSWASGVNTRSTSFVGKQSCIVGVMHGGTRKAQWAWRSSRTAVATLIATSVCTGASVHYRRHRNRVVFLFWISWTSIKLGVFKLSTFAL